MTGLGPFSLSLYANTSNRPLIKYGDWILVEITTQGMCKRWDGLSQASLRQIHVNAQTKIREIREP